MFHVRACMLYTMNQDHSKGENCVADTAAYAAE